MQFKNSPSCDTIIVNYNTGSLLKDCVTSVFKAGASRVIVVDNASSDNSIVLLRQAISTEQLIIVCNSHNLGFAAACNIGIGYTDATHLLFLNPDSTIAPDALIRMQVALELDSTAGMAGGLLCNLDGSEQAGGRRYLPTPAMALVRMSGLHLLNKIIPGLLPDFQLTHTPLPEAPEEVEAISGACMLVKRAAMDDVGQWDDAYFVHCEDLDWCARFRQRQWKILFVPDARITHVHRGSSKKIPIFVEWHKHNGISRFYQKFFHDKYNFLFMSLVSLGIWAHFCMLLAYYLSRHALIKVRLIRESD